jgi:peptide/nickel transport system permease protein
MSRLRSIARQLAHYPSAVFGLLLILGVVCIAIYCLATIPYSEAIRLWRGGEDVWGDYPKNAMPAWVNIFPGVDVPVTIVVNSAVQKDAKTAGKFEDGMRETTIDLTFDYKHGDFPAELSLFYKSSYKSSQPFVSATWITPDGREIRISDGAVSASQTLRLSSDRNLQRRLRNQVPHVGLFADPNSATETPLKGTYTLRIEAMTFEEESTVDAKLVVYGKAHGLAGTDNRRRDIMVALLWGAPIALAFGFLAAVGTTVTTMMIAAVGVWFGGWIDFIIQRLTEINLILPLLPILIMVGTFYSHSIWVLLGCVIVLGIFGSSIKTYRAMFLQVKESPYIEAARAYGAGNLRIIFHYMIPRVIPVLVPQFVTLIPSYVFLEATLSLLGLGDPVLPTWGKVLSSAYYDGALFKGYYYWVLEPSVLLMLTGLGFAMLGFALDRVFNPRLRGQ